MHITSVLACTMDLGTDDKNRDARLLWCFAPYYVGTHQKKQTIQHLYQVYNFITTIIKSFMDTLMSTLV